MRAAGGPRGANVRPGARTATAKGGGAPLLLLVLLLGQHFALAVMPATAAATPGEVGGSDVPAPLGPLPRNCKEPKREAVRLWDAAAVADAGANPLWDWGHESGRWRRDLPEDSNCSSGLLSDGTGFEAMRAKVAAITGVETLGLPPPDPATGTSPTSPSLGNETALLPPVTDGDVIINLGQGTTGTHGVWFSLTEAAAGAHFGLLRNKFHAITERGLYDLLQITKYGFRDMDACAKQNVVNTGERDCRASTMAPATARGLWRALRSGTQHVSDSPWGYFASDVLALAGPQMRIMESLREGVAWSQARDGHGHGGTPICKPQYAAKAHSWFNLGECMMAAGDAAEAWETISAACDRDELELGPDRRFERLAAKFELHTAYIDEIVPAARLHKVCIWDGGNEGLVGVRFRSGCVTRGVPRPPERAKRDPNRTRTHKPMEKAGNVWR